MVHCHHPDDRVAAACRQPRHEKSGTGGKQASIGVFFKPRRVAEDDPPRQSETREEGHFCSGSHRHPPDDDVSQPCTEPTTAGPRGSPRDLASHPLIAGNAQTPLLRPAYTSPARVSLHEDSSRLRLQGRALLTLDFTGGGSKSQRERGVVFKWSASCPLHAARRLPVGALWCVVRAFIGSMGNKTMSAEWAPSYPINA